jgi:demethylmenaquinone methyltransferase/2-methoxy-6-polyprenyl-1,4-benzoquinol methylase
MGAKFNLKAKDYLDSAESKRFYNLQHFTESAPRYDLATKMLSFGRDAAWKRKLIAILPIDEQAPFCVDIACGTGDIAIGVAKKYPTGEVLGTDLTQAMVDIANVRNTLPNLKFETADMCSLDLRSSSVDILTGSYAIRNAPSLNDVLLEINRVLRTGGKAAFLDFSKPRSKLSQKIQFALLKFWGSFCGLVLHGNPEVHGYISQSIKDFPDEIELDKKLKAAGFKKLKEEKLYFGMLKLILLQKASDALTSNNDNR